MRGKVVVDARRAGLPRADHDQVRQRTRGLARSPCRSPHLFTAILAIATSSGTTGRSFRATPKPRAEAAPPSGLAEPDRVEGIARLDGRRSASPPRPRAYRPE